jgi:xylulokinase
LEVAIAGQRSPEDWIRACGHLPERMDPALRVLWWRQNEPAVTARARYFLGWHEFLTLRLGGRPVTDRSLAGKWLCYDPTQGGWSDQRLGELDIERSLLPEVHAWGTAELAVLTPVAAQLGLPEELRIAVGAFDASCAALGAGASETGIAALLCGSWEGLVVPAQPPAMVLELAERAMSLGPHPGQSGFAVFALSPNGTTVVDWGRELTSIPLAGLEARLQASGAGPSPVLAVPHLSGATVPWAEGRKSRGLLAELTLAASGTDVVKALMEGIAFDLAFTLSLLRTRNVAVRVLRVAGGGARSVWWMQLKSDLSGVPLEVVDTAESGTYGAALLAGRALGIHLGRGEAGPEVRRYQPDPARADLYAKRLEVYRAAASDLMASEWRKQLEQ